MLWKNLVISLRAPARVIIVVLLPLGLAIAIKSLVHDAILHNMTPLAIPYTVLMLTFAAERELRGELRQANIIKAMPVSGTQMVLVLVLYWWLLTLVVVAVIAASILLFIPQAGLSILGISVICSLAFSFACLSALSIPPLLYSDARDWLQAMISQFFSLFLVGIVVMPTGITLAILLMLKVNLVITSLVIVVVNVVLGWCALSIAGLLFARFDPTSD
jgi:hypothetical protein